MTKHLSVIRRAINLSIQRCLDVLFSYSAKDVHTAIDLRDNITCFQVYEAINSSRILMNAKVFAQHILQGTFITKRYALKANEIATILTSFCRGKGRKKTVVFNLLLHFSSSCDSLKWLT